MYEKQAERFHALDALRGLAALIVVLMHFHDLLFGKERRAHLSHLKLVILYIASPLRSGASAVALFFVLSGFVLALPLLKGKQPSYGTYAVRRIIRIYLPYLFALFIAVWGDTHFHGQLPEGMWQSLPWPTAPTAAQVWQHVLFLGRYNVLAFNFVFWTLVIEMRVSLAYPFLAKALLRFRFRKTLILNAAILGLLTVLALRYPGSDALKTLRFACFFIVGFLLAQQRDSVRQWYQELPSSLRATVAALSLLGFGYNIALRATAPVSDLVCLLSSIGVIITALYDDRWKRFLQRQAPQCLGQISYSLYLTHLPVLFFDYLLIGRHLSTLPFLAVYLTTSMIIATLFYTTVERTFLLLSRRYGRTVSGLHMVVPAPSRLA